MLLLMYQMSQTSLDYELKWQLTLGAPLVQYVKKLMAAFNYEHFKLLFLYILFAVSGHV